MYPSASVGSSYPSASGTPARTQSTPQAYPGAGASYQVQSIAQPEAEPAARERRPIPVMGIVLGILAVVAMVLLGFVIFVFTRGYEGPAGASSSSATSTPSPSATTDEPVKFPAPAGATKMDNFTAPSGNIKCSFTADGVTCGIADSDWEEEGYASCSGTKIGTLTATKTDATQSCATSMPSGGPKLEYTTAAMNGDYACRSTEDGVTCWNTKSGKSFALSRSGWMTGTNGEISPDDFAWNE